MRKTVVTIIKKIKDYLKAIVADELEVMDAFYQQFA